MRKNGINRELRVIEGGVCAPTGYKANAVASGIRKDGSLDFGMIYSERRCSVACVYAAGKTVGAPVRVSKKNMRNGYVRAVLVNGGIANCIQEDGENLALSVCDLLFWHTIERTEIVIASTGKIGEHLSLAPFEKGIKPLWEGLASSEKNSLKVAQAIRSEESEGKQLSFSFDLGDYPCKIGAVFKGGKNVAPNMATFLAFLTTDVNISTPMLQKALEAEVRETFNLLNLDGVASPNDTVCIMANGRAGNYRIDCADSEYKKFTLALRGVLTEICRATAKEGAEKVLSCRVMGARSKEVSRAVSKTIAGLKVLKECIKRNEMDVESILFAALDAAKPLHAEELRIFLRSAGGEIALYEGERTLYPNKQTLERIYAAEEVEIGIDYREGNFQSLAFGCVS